MSSAVIIAAVGLCFLLAFAAGLFIFIILRRLAIMHLDKRRDRLYRLIENDILEVISSSEPQRPLQVAFKYRSYPTVLTEVLLNYGDLLLGGSKKRLQVIFDHGLKERCLKNLMSRRTVKRLQGARLFITFFDPAESAHLFRLIQDKPIVKLTTITALSHTPHPETLHFVFKAFEQDDGSAVTSYFNIMFGLGSRIELLVRLYLKKPLPPQKLGLLIELVGAVPLRPLYKDIAIYADHPDKEVRIRVARALGRLLIPESASLLTALASDEAWEVKAQALKSLGKLGNPATLDILAQSLFSRYWYVRHNAGYALANMGEEGLKRLREIASQQKDPYAADMSSMVLNDLIYLGEAA
jgi:hypothetical protein